MLYFHQVVKTEIVTIPVSICPGPQAMGGISAIAKLPPDGVAKISCFVRDLDTRRQLTGEELGALAERLTAAKTEAEGDAIREIMIRGFYGSG